jgi:hypothetical protein
MTIDWSLLPVAFAGGALGAALGASAAFIFTGIFVLIGVAVAAGGGGKEFIGGVAFGPLLGPHVSFVGGVAAAAFAGRIGQIPAGRDLGRGLAGLGRLDVLVVGGVFGVLGFVVQALLGEVYARAFLIHGDTHIDPPAATIATLTFVLKLLF